MRKYKGRDNHGEWHYGWYKKEIDGSHWIREQISPNHYADYKVVSKTVGQSTGQTDKHNIEVYDGDRIRYNFRTKDSNEEFTSEVFYGEYMWLTDEHSLNRINNVEIIGNKYEPEKE